MQFEVTSKLKIAYEAGGPSDGHPVVVLLHGWPDDVRTYDRVVPALHAARFRTVAPYLRGFGDTAFISKDAMRSGEIVAMAQDTIDLADALNLQKFAVIGHDWGARIAYALAIAVPQRLADCDCVGWLATGRVANPESQTSPSVLVPVVHDDEARPPSGAKQRKSFRTHPVGELESAGLV